jgi:hypothetical protein
LGDIVRAVSERVGGESLMELVDQGDRAEASERSELRYRSGRLSGSGHGERKEDRGGINEGSRPNPFEWRSPAHFFF